MQASNQTVFDYVLKVTTDTLDLVRDNTDPLRTQLSGFIYNNLGINVDTKVRKYEVLDNIEVLYTERRKKISEYHLDKLEEKFHGLDRNDYENIQTIIEFIKNNYNVVIEDYELCPSIDSHSILDNVMSKMT